jgi:3,4-dihydroxy 2-butanone 4-phosphate synthase/GTP cyclohydrolase II
MPLSRVEELVADIRAGKMVILMDDEDRENEGDLVIAATHVRPEDINFMITHARGLVCLTLSRDRCKQLNLPLMVDQNGAQHATNFTLSIEAAEGISTVSPLLNVRIRFAPQLQHMLNQAISFNLVIFSH